MTTLAATAVLASGAMAMAPAAGAVGSSKCNSNFSNTDFDVLKSNASLRTGPSSNYSSKGHLAKYTKFYYYCEYTTKSTSWYYGKILTGAHKGTKGWVYAKYIGLRKP
ncbi:SH3 domain-containing protein [Streptomyces sp. NPDC001922]|uniref:SH3 domain-containing protein n=1 Tax=Streptomyces sp. NPDC001922 TaxID=3364624 RepID=UPI00368A7AF0